MKYSKRYIVFGVLVAAMLIFKLELGASGSGTVENFHEPICRRQHGTH